MNVQPIDCQRRYLFECFDFIFVVYVPVDWQLQHHRLVGVFAHLADYKLAMRGFAANVRLEYDSLLHFLFVEVLARVQVLAIAEELVHSIIELVRTHATICVKHEWLNLIGLRFQTQLQVGLDKRQDFVAHDQVRLFHSLVQGVRLNELLEK